MGKFQLIISELLRKTFAVAANQALQETNLAIKKDVLAAQYLRPFMPRYFPWTTGSLRPSCLITIVNDIILNQRSTIVECGAGLSTLLIARVLKEYGGVLLTLEEDRKWAQFVGQRLKLEELDNNVRVIQAPIIRQEPDEYPWYDRIIIEPIIESYHIDLLIVDGPGDSRRRFPAIPFFKNYMSEQYAIIVDDLSRGTAKFLPKWEGELGISFRNLGEFAWASTNPDFKVFLMP